MTNQEKKQLAIAACQIRMGIIESTHGAKAGHPGGSLSAAEMFAYLYNRELRIDPKQPKMESRDRFVLSKGHTAPGLYSALAYRGFFPVSDLPTLRHADSYLQGHPNMNLVPGVDMSTGSLGQGLSIGLGMALGQKLAGLDRKTYVLLGDGEIAEGQVWEAVMAAPILGADNLVALVDNNGLQATDFIKKRFNTLPLAPKFQGFGWHVIEIDGHDMAEILSALDAADGVKGVPTVIIAHTVKGKGVSFAENVPSYHNGALTAEQYEQAMAELA